MTSRSGSPTSTAFSTTTASAPSSSLSSPPKTPRRKYVVFSGGEALGAKLGLEKTGNPILFGIGRTGLADLLPRVLEHSAK